MRYRRLNKPLNNTLLFYEFSATVPTKLTYVYFTKEIPSHHMSTVLNKRNSGTSLFNLSQNIEISRYFPFVRCETHGKLINNSCIR